MSRSGISRFALLTSPDGNPAGDPRHRPGDLEEPMCRKPLTIEFLFNPGCCCAGPALRVLRQVLRAERCEAPVTVRCICDEEKAARYRFHGSPTILIDGVDLEGPALDRDGYRLRCRTYYPHGECLGVPAADLIQRALCTHPGKRHPLAAGS